MPKKPVMNTIPAGESRPLVIHADEYYSHQKVKVVPGERYHITCANDQVWKDWGRPSFADGIPNPAAELFGMRVKGGVKCFCLCGCFNDKAKSGFAIGFSREFDIPEGASSLSFFANDTWGFYWNNTGSITITVKRIQ